jgi:hypothetical protein
VTRSSIRRFFAAGIVLWLCMLGACWPAAHGAALRDAVTAVSPLSDLLQPSTSDLESAFTLVGQGQVPAGYPQANQNILVPPTLLKAIAWTESTWRQFTNPGSTLVSYDGGYGLMQITSGMYPGGLPDITQSAIAANFLYNIDYGAQMLVDKFLHTPNIGNDDPAVLENWYYALWAYNGWGWVNNPNNPVFTRIGTPATNPAAFPYQERVLYWVAHPPTDAAGQPLWPAIPVTLPSAAEIGINPGPLPETSTPHYDVAMPVPALNLSGQDNAAFLYDVSIPDGTVVAPGAHLHKVWLLRNRGPRSWGPGYTWVPEGGAQLSLQPVQVPITPPLAAVTISADLTAPSVPGYYREYWQMHGPDGTPFGVIAWVDIRVSATAPLLPSAKPRPPTNPQPASGAPVQTANLVQKGATGIHVSKASQVTQQPASLTAVNGDDAIFAGDVTVPDGTVFAPGQHFVKTWRIRNIGTHAWSAGYRWHFEAGSQLSAVNSVPVAATAPGATVEISVPMSAPSQTGVYTSFWQMTNPAGVIFGHQAWASIVVRKPATGGSPQATPTATPVPTLRPTPRPSPRATPTATPPPPTPTATLEPTVVLPGGDGKMIASPWTGALAYRAYYAAGSTIHGLQETLALSYPGPGAAHVQVNLYRPDAAYRTLEFTLQAGDHQILNLNRIAPGTDLATEILSDRRLISTRLLRGAHTMLGDPGAARTARYWWFPATGPLPAGGTQELVFYNPHGNPATVLLNVGKPQGGCCLAPRRIVVPPREQYAYQFGAGDWSGPLALSASDVVAVERLVIAADWSQVREVPGTAVIARHWYLPAIQTGANAGIALFNPGSATVHTTLHVIGGRGTAAQENATIGPFSQIVLPVGGTPGGAVSAQIDANALIVAGASVPSGSSDPLSYLGSIGAESSWLLLGSAAGRDAQQSLTLYNPGVKPSGVTVRFLHGASGPSLHLTVPPHGRLTRMVDKWVQGGTLIDVTATAPIVVARTVTTADGTAVSTGLSPSAS